MKAFCLVAGLALTAVGCTPDYGEDNQSPVIISVINITAAAGGGGAGSGVGTVLNSDVTTNDSVFNDNATITVQNIPKNQTAEGLLVGQVNDVILERYEVAYLRSDGRNTQGVDVPFTITGPVDAVVPFNGSVSVPITIVRHQAKSEPPLANLQGGGGAFVLTTSARITLHGRTISRKSVQATGQLQITFADFADQ